MFCHTVTDFNLNIHTCVYIPIHTYIATGNNITYLLVLRIRLFSLKLEDNGSQIHYELS